MIYLIGYGVIINVIAFFVYGLDKRKARKGKRRISEKALFIYAWIGGSIGAILGMQVFRHKTKHWKFKIGLPCILLLQILVIVGVIILFKKW